MGYHRLIRQSETPTPMAYSEVALEALMTDVESDLVEPKAAFDGGGAAVGMVTDPRMAALRILPANGP